MIRVVIFLIAVALAAFGAAWLADRPGDVVITWLGYHVETSVGVALGAIALIAIGAVLLWGLFRAIVRSPADLAAALRRRRETRGLVAISRGLIAIGAGDLAAARRHAGAARRHTPDQPLALLLAAQTAQLGGDRAAADATFRQMAGHAETRLLGLHGLYVEAQRRNDVVAARIAAEDAVNANPSAAWAAQAVLDFRCARQDWAGALAALDSNFSSGLIDKPMYRRRRAVLLTARALSSGDRDQARADVLEAVKLAPGLVPAAALAGRLLGEAGETRKAARVVEAAWRENPHPDLAEAYAHVRPGDSARDRLARVQVLARMNPTIGGSEPEGMLAVARAAIDAREFAVARAALEPLLAAPTRRVALMMAEIEEHDTGDIGRARQWMARALNAARDPAWTADGLVSGKWLPASPASGKLDAFQWKVPLADLGPPGPVIDLSEPTPAPVQGPRPAPAHPAPAQAEEDAPEFDGSPPWDASAGPHEEPSAPQPPTSQPPTSQAPAPQVASSPDLAPDDTSLPVVLPRRPPPRAPEPYDSVIPLVHRPDDPGPEGELPADPAPETTEPEGWKKLRGLFR